MGNSKDISPEFREFMEKIMRRPGAYIGGRGDSLYLLRAFLDGVDTYRNFRNEPYLTPAEFTDFVREYYHSDIMNLSGISLILYYETGEHAAFEKFRELLNRFLESRGYEPIPESSRKSGCFHRDGTERIYLTDIDKLAMSYADTFNKPPWNDNWSFETAFTRLRDMYKSPGFFGIALWDSDTPAAAVMGRYEQYFDGIYYRIEELWTAPDYRRQGKAKILLNGLAEALKERDVKKIYLITARGDMTESFYRHNGFSVINDMCVMDIYL